MNPEVLEKVLACRSLPTLPAVAMRVVELTTSDQVSMKDLAETIQNDQALAAKILRTVNSSMYALRTRCSSINQAIVMLGLSAVKTLALGFSLVTAIKESDTAEFDLSDHWRRALYSGIAARLIATKGGLNNPEECFLGGLLQDLGMIALYQSLGKPYLDIVARSERDHRRVAKFELEALEVQHGDVGALLAKRWKLPEQLVMPIKYHERPTAAPMEHTATVRAVGLGNIASDVLTSAEPAAALRRYYDRAEQWFALDAGRADEVLMVIGQATKEVASLLSVPTGPLADAQAVLSAARERLAEVEVPARSPVVDPLTPAKESQDVDDLTGAASRFNFDRTMVAAFEQARAGIAVLSLVLVDVDGLEEINTQYGREAGDTVLISVCGRLERAFAGLNAMTVRYDGGRLAVLLHRTGRTEAVKAAEKARQEIAETPVELIAAKSGAPAKLSVTVSLGVACVEQSTAERLEQPAALCAVVEQAVRLAKRAGRNTVRVYAPATPAAAAA